MSLACLLARELALKRRCVRFETQHAQNGMVRRVCVARICAAASGLFAELHFHHDRTPFYLEALGKSIGPHAFADALFVAAEERQNFARSIILRQLKSEFIRVAERGVSGGSQPGPREELLVE